METYTIPRSGNAPLRFEGELLAEFNGERFAGREQNRWYELRLYRSGDRYVVHVAYRTRWEGEASHDAAYVGSAAEVRQALRRHNPVPASAGYPRRQEYEDRQAALEAQLRDQYDAGVSVILDRDEFAESLEQAERDQYAALDLQYVESFVRVQLAGFPLSRGEACALCDANNGAMLLPDFSPIGLGANIHDTPAAALAEKWQCDAAGLARQIDAADRGTQFALAWAVAQFWRRCDLETDEALRQAGFTVR